MTVPRVPAGELLNGLETHALEDGQTMPVSAVVIVRYLTPDGKASTAYRLTEGLSPHEAVGMIEVMKTDLVKDLVGALQPIDIEDD